MMRYSYPLEIETAEDGVTVTSPDIPELITCGDSAQQALDRAPDALISALSFYVDDNRPVPVPSPPAGRPVADPGILVAAKLALHDAMVAERVSNIELARRLDRDEKEIRRMRDPLHRSHIGQIEDALRTLGRHAELEIRAA